MSRIGWSAEKAQAVRFLLVGATNTAIGLGVFAVLYRLWGEQITYLGALLIAYAVGTVVGFFLHRRLVFRVEGSPLLDFVRYTGVQATAFALNAVILPILVEAVHVPVIPGQVVSLGLVVLASYFGHKFISFRRPGHVASPDLVPSSGAAGTVAGLARGDDDGRTERQVDPSQ